jgi:4-hydroxythreonine-4-phosphate dehydrogenase
VKQKPLIAITMGDPAGIGPEVTVKALASKEIYDVCRPVVVGDLRALRQALKITGVNLETISIQERIPSCPWGAIPVLCLSDLSETCCRPAVPTPEGGRAMVSFIHKAVEMCMQGRADAMVTGPITKVLLHEAGCLFEGHTQLIATLTGARDYVMMLAGERIRVSLVTTHCRLLDVSSLLSKEAILSVILITYNSLLKDFAIPHPRLAVAALNPHAGECGLFGSEERDIIEPAVMDARQANIPVEGPFPADTLFYRAYRGEFDAVIAMYHDQGLIPLKLVHFSDAVNITLGLPIIRTSVDHGTAYDIAGKGIADPSSMTAAIKTAARMALNRKAGGFLRAPAHAEE